MTTLIPKFDLKDGSATPTGAVNRPINQKLAEVISVKDFGAVGDGVVDDTTAIQAAINSANGVKVYFPAGTYKVTSPLSVPNSAYLYGDYLASTIQTSTSSSIITNANPASFIYVTLTDLVLQGGTFGVYLDVSAETAYNTFTNLFFKEQTDTNFYVNKLLQVSNFTNCNFYNGERGVVCNAFTANLNNFTNCIFSAHEFADVEFTKSEVNNFISCYFGLALSPGNNASTVIVDGPNNLSFNGCYFEDGHTRVLAEFNSNGNTQFSDCHFTWDNTRPTPLGYLIDSDGVVTLNNCSFTANVTKGAATKLVYTGVNQPQVNTNYYAEFSNGFHKLASLPNTYPVSGTKNILQISSLNVYSGQLIGTLNIQYQSIESGGFNNRWLYAQYRIVVGCLLGSATLYVHDIALISSDYYVPSGPAISVAVTQNVGASTATNLVFEAAFTGVTTPTGGSLFTWTFDSTGGAAPLAGFFNWYLTPSIID